MIEWAEVAPGWALIASRDRAWLHRLSPVDPFARRTGGPGDPEAVRRLLDAAIVCFQRERLRSDAAPLTVEAYVERVVACYHGGHATPPLMRRAAEKFAAADRPDLARWAWTTAEDEDHDHLALADLAELGYPPDVVESIPCPPRMQAAITYFGSCVDSDEPVSCMGYIYALERPASLVQGSYVDAIAKLLGPGINATRCLRWHSSLGEEPGHTERLLRTIASLCADERATVVRAAYETSRIMFAGD